MRYEQLPDGTLKAEFDVNDDDDKVIMIYETARAELEHRGITVSAPKPNREQPSNGAVWDMFITDELAEDGRIEFRMPPLGHKREVFVWWLITAWNDFNKTVPKTDEYSGTGGGSPDLQLLGDNLSELLNMHDTADALKLELGCWFYLCGKVSRMVSNYKQKKPAKEDTLLDATVYTMMMRRIQAKGIWP